MVCNVRVISDSINDMCSDCHPFSERTDDCRDDANLLSKMTGLLFILVSGSLPIRLSHVGIHSASLCLKYLVFAPSMILTCNIQQVSTTHQSTSTAPTVHTQQLLRRSATNKGQSIDQDQPQQPHYISTTSTISPCRVKRDT